MSNTPWWPPAQPPTCDAPPWTWLSTPTPPEHPTNPRHGRRSPPPVPRPPRQSHTSRSAVPVHPSPPGPPSQHLHPEVPEPPSPGRAAAIFSGVQYVLAFEISSALTRCPTAANDP